MTTEPTAPNPDEWDLPASWTQGARDLFAEVLEQSPDLSGAGLGSLETACSLVAAAERLDDVALAAGMLATGSTGQVIVHPAVVEARLARTAAASILARLVPDDPGSFRARQRAAAQSRNRRP